uniref:Microprotein domain-containing protein n=1 Tax=Babesia bovis TaxID=5865 RepID=S6B9E8_BABBO|nr:hypothetical protein [Babesia bovis]
MCKMEFGSSSSARGNILGISQCVNLLCKIAIFMFGAVAVGNSTCENSLAVDAEQAPLVVEPTCDVDKLLSAYAPDEVVFTTSKGKEYTNKDIEDLIDHNGLNGSENYNRDELGRRRSSVIRQMREFDDLVKQIPEKLAQQAESYRTWEELPDDLSKNIAQCMFNKRYGSSEESSSNDVVDSAVNAAESETISDELMKDMHDSIYGVVYT